MPRDVECGCRGLLHDRTMRGNEIGGAACRLRRGPGGEVRLVEHDFAQRRRRARLYPLARAGQHVLCRGERRRTLARGLAKCRLQRAYGPVERQAVTLQNLRGRAAPISDDRRKHDGTVDVAPASAACRSRGSFQDAQKRRRRPDRDNRRPVRTLVETGEVRDHLRLETASVDVAGGKNVDGILVVA